MAATSLLLCRHSVATLRHASKYITHASGMNDSSKKTEPLEQHVLLQCFLNNFLSKEKKSQFDPLTICSQKHAAKNIKWQPSLADPVTRATWYKTPVRV